MNEEELKRLFAEVDQEQPDADAKARAIQLAEQAFAENTSAALNKKNDKSEKNLESDQGNAHLLRPIETNRRKETRKMQTWNRWMNPGLAAAATLVLATGVGLSLVVPNIVGRPDVARETVANLPANKTSLPSPQLEELEEIVVTASKDASLATLLDSVKQGKRVAESRARTQEFARQPMAVGRPYIGDAITPFPPGMNPYQATNRDNFESFDSNPVRTTRDAPVSTFSIDVDTAAYSFVRKQLNQGLLPPVDAVRLEEMVNYFPYDYAPANSLDEPFKSTVTVLPAPWNSNNKLVHIGIKGYEHAGNETSGSNLVFLLDVSGSMNAPDKLPLVKQSMNLLLGQLQADDTVAIVVYAGAAGTVLEPTPVSEKAKILSALDRLRAGGSTAGAAGIELAYQLAESNFVEGGVNRVFLATDGDFNVGMSNHSALQTFIEKKRDRGVYLSVLGFGQGNYQDALMQKLAQNGNGIAAYIDTLGEAQKVLVQEASAQLFPIANDVKIQVEFNPATVSEYRLLGYETRALKQEDFNNDKVDAGEIGAGHSVTAIYEITPTGTPGLIDPSRYAPESNEAASDTAIDAAIDVAFDVRTSDEYGFLKIRYKKPGERESQLMTQPISIAESGGTTDVRFAVAVAGFAELLRGGKHTGEWNFDDAIALALANRGEDPYGYRSEFVQLIRRAMVASPAQQ